MTKIPVLHEHGIIGGAFLLPHQEGVGNIPHDKIPGKNGEKNKPNKHVELNSPKIPVINEHGIISDSFLLSPQEDDGNIPHDEISGKMGNTANLTNTGIPIHTIW